MIAARKRIAPALLVALAFLGIGPASSPAQAPAQARPGPARLAPRDGLTFLFEYDGVDADPAAWRGTAAYAVLNATPSGEALASVARQVIAGLVDEKGEVKAEVFAEVGDHLARHGWLLALYKDEEGLLVLPGFGKQEVRDKFLRLLELAARDKPGREPVRFDLRGRTIKQDVLTPPKADAGQEPKPEPKPPALVDSWWFEGDDLVITSAPPRGPDGARLPAADAPAPAVDMLAMILDAADGKAPNLSDHPGRLAALAEGAGVAGFAANGLFVVEDLGAAALADIGDFGDRSAVDILDSLGLASKGEVAKQEAANAERDKSLREAPAPDGPTFDEIKALGLDGVKRVVGRWGFRGRALMTAVRFEYPEPRTGLSKLLEQPRLRLDALPPIPRDANRWAVGTLDPAPGLDAMVAAIRASDPDGGKSFDEEWAQYQGIFREQTGLSLRDDVLAPLGPTWCAYSTKMSIRESEPIGIPALLVSVRDREAIGRSIDSAMARLNETLRAMAPPADGKADAAPSIVFEPLPAPDRGYRLVSPGGFVPWLGPEVQPTVLLGDRWLIVAANPDLARAAKRAEVDPEARWKPTGEVLRTFEALPPGLTSLSVGDPGDSAWPDQLASLPLVAQYFGNMVGSVNPKADAPAPTPGSAILGMLGVPGPGGFRIRLDPAKIPKASEIRPHLFPSVLSTVVDGRGLLFLGTEALPLNCLGEAGVKFNNGNKGGDGKGKKGIEFNLGKP